MDVYDGYYHTLGPQHGHQREEIYISKGCQSERLGLWSGLGEICLVSYRQCCLYAVDQWGDLYHSLQSRNCVGTKAGVVMLSDIITSVENFYNRGALPETVLLDLAYFTVKEIERRKNYSLMLTYAPIVGDGDPLLRFNWPPIAVPPVSWLAPKCIQDIWNYVDNLRVYPPIERVDFRRLEYLRNAGVTSETTPRVYALTSTYLDIGGVTPKGQFMYFWPPLLLDQIVLVDYYGYSTKLVSTGSTYWLEDVAPDVLIYGMLSKLHMYGFEDDRASTWLKFYSQAMGDLAKSEVKARESGRIRIMPNPGAEGVGR